MSGGWREKDLEGKTDESEQKGYEQERRSDGMIVERQGDVKNERGWRERGVM